MGLIIYGICAIIYVAFEVEFTDEFGEWFDSLDEHEQESVDEGVSILASGGPNLGRLHVDTVKGSAFANMKELRVQHAGRPYRVLFAFDPRRCAMLLIGGHKTGNNRWQQPIATTDSNNRFYIEMVPKADAIYAQHLREIERE